jgi:hypothetical protein
MPALRSSRRSPRCSPRYMLKPIAAAVVLLGLGACGGGSSDGSTPVPPPSTVTRYGGFPVDGYLAWARIECVRNGVVIAQTTSNSIGQFQFDVGGGLTCEKLRSIGGVDVGITFTDFSDDIARPDTVMEVVVPPGTPAADLARLFITSLGTLQAKLIAGGLSASEAQARVLSSLGLPAGTNLLTTDPTASLALYKAASVVSQLAEQISEALAAADGVSTAAERAALADIVYATLAARLSTLTLADLTPAPGTLTPTSPLVALIEQITRAAQTAGIGGLAGLNPQTLALIAAPLVASATNSVNAGTSVQDIVNRVGVIEDQDRTGGIVLQLRSLLDNTADNPQAILDTIAGAIAIVDAGAPPQPISLTVGADTASASVSSAPGNYARLVDDEIRFYNPASVVVSATLPEFETGSGVTVAQNLIRIGFNLDELAGSTQLGAPIEVPMALDIRDATRTFQAFFDRVRLRLDDSNRVIATLPAGVRMSVYGKTSTAETTSPLVIALAGDALNIVRTLDSPAGEITLDFNRMFDAIAAAAGDGSALDRLATDRVSSGVYQVVVAFGGLRIARSVSATDSAPRLATPYGITMPVTGGPVTSGYGFRGQVNVTP